LKTFFSGSSSVDLLISRLKAYFQEVNGKIYTNSDIAKELGVSAPTLSNWKNSEDREPDLSLIFSKCEQINLNWLIYGEGSMLKGSSEVNEPREIYGGETKCELCKDKDKQINRLEKINDTLMQQLDRCNADLDNARDYGQKKKAV
jgi:transcriptional regulator with XRE-family HTH domain